MQPRTVVVFLLAAMLVAPWARADDKKAETIPLKLFAKAKAGDWVALSLRFTEEDISPDPAPNYATITVESVEKDAVEVRIHWARMLKESKATFKAKDNVPLGAYAGLLVPAASCRDVKIEKAKRKLAGTEIACQKISFTSAGNEGDQQNTLWVAPEAKGYGLVALELKRIETGTMRVRGAKAKRTSTTTIEVVGLGTAEKTESGMTAADARAAASDNAKRLPFNPFENAKVGDWRASEFYESETHMGYASYRIESVEDTRVLLASEFQGPGPTEERSTKEAPTLRETFLSDKKYDPFFTDYKVEDATYTLGNRTFKCKKVSFTMTLEYKREKLEEDIDAYTVWFSTEVKGDGLLYQERRSRDGSTSIGKTRLVGFGSAEKTEWGKTAKESEVAGKGK